MKPQRTMAILLGAGAAVGAAATVLRHGRGTGGHAVPGGVVMGDAAGYDRFSRFLLGRFYAKVADDIAASAPREGRVLEVGCGPGHLSLRLARHDALEVTGLDLDPAMIERARANAQHPGTPGGHRPSFVVGDAAALPFPDASFDVVASTLSMHHWADPAAALAEMGRVLRAGGRALIWDIRPGAVPLHRHAVDPAEHTRGTGLRIVASTPWRWPWRLTLAQRLELAPDGSGGVSPEV